MCCCDPCGLTTVTQTFVSCVIGVFVGGYFVKWLKMAWEEGGWPSVWTMATTSEFLEIDGIHLLYGTAFILGLWILLGILRCFGMAVSSLCRRAIKRRSSVRKLKLGESDSSSSSSASEGDDDDFSVITRYRNSHNREPMCCPHCFRGEDEETGSSANGCGQSPAGITIFVGLALAAGIILARKLINGAVIKEFASGILSSGENVALEAYELDLTDLYILLGSLFTSILFFGCRK